MTIDQMIDNKDTYSDCNQNIFAIPGDILKTVKNIHNLKCLYVSSQKQMMQCFENTNLCFTYSVSTAKNGLGEQINSECTPRGWHKIYSIIGSELIPNSVMVSRTWTGEIFTDSLLQEFPNRDWILTRILQLDGLEEGKNKGGDVDSLKRYIYIHGTPDTTDITKPGSRGCIRMRNKDIIELAGWVNTDTLVYIF